MNSGSSFLKPILIENKGQVIGNPLFAQPKIFKSQIAMFAA
jgi:hypothetical protein